MAMRRSSEKEHGEGLLLLKTTNVSSNASGEHQMGKSSAEKHVEFLVITPPSFSVLHEKLGVLATKSITTSMSSKELLWLKENLKEYVNYPLRVLDTTACPGNEEGLMGLKCHREEHMVKTCSLFLMHKNLTITAARFEDQAGLMNIFSKFEERSVQSLVAKLSSETVACPGHQDLIWLKFNLNKEQEGHSVNFIDRSLTYLLPGTTVSATRSNDQVVLKKNFGEFEDGTIQLVQSILPYEVIVFEILTRVSLGPLLHQFQWVCRDWHNCIHESKFQLIHSQRTPIVASGCFVVMERSVENISDSIKFFPFNNDPSSPPRNPSPSLDFLPSPVGIAGSSPYGSLLCCVTLDKLRTRKSIPIFYICKPATREWRKIPNPRTKFTNFGMRIVVTQTYPTLQYKIVRISATRGVILEYHCELFDSVTWAWKRLADLKTLGCLHDTFGGVLINGCLHWISDQHQIHVLSIEQEKWNAIIQLPPDTVESELNRYLLILIDGKIGVMISNKECTELWVLENYYNRTSWKRRYRKDLKALNREVGGMCIPIAVSLTGIIFMLCLCSNTCGVMYNMKDDTYTISAPFPADSDDAIRFAITKLGNNYIPPTMLNLDFLPFRFKWIPSVLNKAISKTISVLMLPPQFVFGGNSSYVIYLLKQSNLTLWGMIILMMDGVLHVVLCGFLWFAVTPPVNAICY